MHRLFPFPTLKPGKHAICVPKKLVGLVNKEQHETRKSEEDNNRDAQVPQKLGEQGEEVRNVDNIRHVAQSPEELD
jgi:hypothetical protein